MPGRRNWKGSDEHHEKNASLLDLSELDKARAAFVRQYLGLKWPDPYLYDAMFNTASGHSFVADMLVRCVPRVPGGTQAQPLKIASGPTLIERRID